MFEPYIALKYLLPKRKSLSSSIISILSLFVISLVIWLILVFLSVTMGIEKNWITKLTSLNAPLRITPTHNYYDSHYYKIDSISSESNYTIKNLKEKSLSFLSNPYDKNMDIEISSKMSKSKPRSCLYVHDSKEEIKKKIMQAFCPEKTVENNPILDYFKHIIFRKFNTVTIERPLKFGGAIEANNYEMLVKLYREEEIHPLDLKNSVVEYLDKLIKPIREHFEKDKKARELYEIVKKEKITR